MIELYHQTIHEGLQRTYYKMTLSEKIKTTNNKRKQNKAQNNLGKTKNAKILTLSSGNVSRYEFFTGKDVLPENLLEETTKIKRFEHSSLGSELKKQTELARNSIKGLKTFFEYCKEESVKITKKRTINNYRIENKV